MRNYNSKPVFRQPLTSNSFRPTDRVNIQPVPVGQYKPRRFTIENIIIQPKQQRSEYKQQISPILPRIKDNITDKFYLYLQNSVPIIDKNSHMAEQDNRCLWYLALQKFPDRKRSITFQQTQYVITSWSGDKYPNVMYLTIQGVWGYLNQHSVVTDRLCALQLRQVSVIQESGITRYALRYSSNKQVSWQLPDELTHLKLGVKFDNYIDNVVLPLPNPLMLQIKIQQVKQNKVNIRKDYSN